jgi:hypothetical protein
MKLWQAEEKRSERSRKIHMAKNIPASGNAVTGGSVPAAGVTHVAVGSTAIVRLWL